MSFLRWAGRTLLFLLISGSLSLWILLICAQQTILNRQVVLGWFQQSGAYSHVTDAVIQLQQNSSLDEAALKQAVLSALPPSFIQQVTETALNATYDWVEGKTAGINFEVPLSGQRQAFVRALSAELQQRLATLPTCPAHTMMAADAITCIPSGKTAAQVADVVAANSLNGSDFLTQPLTANNLNLHPQAWAAWAPLVAASAGFLDILLPLFAFGFAAILVATDPDKLRATAHVGRHIAWSLAGWTLLGALVWYAGNQLAIAQANVTTQQSLLLTTVVEPILHQALPSLGFWITVTSGSVVFFGIALWITFTVLRRNTHKKLLISAATSGSSPDQPPTQTPPSSQTKTKL